LANPKASEAEKEAAGAGIFGDIAKGQQAFRDGFNEELKKLFDKISTAFKDVFGKLSFNLGEYIGSAIEGAKFGKQVTDLLGIKGSKTGAAIGSAIGKATGLPGAEQIGAAIGSITGGLFKKTPKASATISTGDNQFSAQVSGSKSLRSGVTALGDSVIGSLTAIAEQLGGSIVAGLQLGSIGQRKDKFTFDPTGQGRTKGRGVERFDSEAEAVSAAVRDALLDGAITGLSAAVQQALKSSGNVDKALREALKVQQVEDMLAGFGAGAAKAFRDFETQARDRLRIARQYGFDVVKLEEQHTTERKKLLEDQVGQVSGAARALLENLKFGENFAGNGLERRESLLNELRAQISLAQSGDAPAANKVAELSNQLLGLSQELFGTSASFAEDRSYVQGVLERLVADTQARFEQLQQEAMGPKLDTTNSQLNELNSQTARYGELTLQQLQQLNASLLGVFGNQAPSSLAGTARPGVGSGGYGSFSDSYGIAQHIGQQLIGQIL
jgi:hypothetical protein